MEQSDGRTKDSVILEGEIDRTDDPVKNNATTSDSNMDDSIDIDNSRSFLTKTALTLTLYFGFIVTVIKIELLI